MRAVPAFLLTGPLSDGTRGRVREAISRLSLLTLLVLLALCRAALAFAPGELSIESRSGSLRFTIEFAATPEERARGLMFRESMPDDHGMLFDFIDEQPVAFWMKNTPMPLDMIFIDGGGRVVRIVPDTIPFSETPIPSGQPIRAVLEVRAGTAARLGIAMGDRVRHPIFAAP